MKGYFFGLIRALVPGIFFLVLLWGCSHSPGSVAENLEKEYQEAEEVCSQAAAGKSRDYSPYIFIFDSSGILISWGNNTTPCGDSLQFPDRALISLSNGVYVQHRVKSTHRTAVYLKCLQHNNVRQSSFLQFPNEVNAYISLRKEPGLEEIRFRGQPVYVLPLAFNFSDWKLFNPEYYASSSLNPSLGHLLLNLLLLGIIWLLAEKLLLRKLPVNFLSCLAGSLAVCGGAYLITMLVKSIVRDGKIYLEFFNYTRLNAADLFAQLALVLTVYIFFRVYFWFFRHFRGRLFWMAVALAILFYNLWMHYTETRDLLEINWFVGLLVLPGIPKLADTNFFSWHYLLASLIMVLGIHTVLSKYMNYRISDEQQNIAEKLLNKDDPVAEYLIADNLPELEKQYRESSDPVHFLNENLFTGFLSRYRTDTSVTSDSERFTFRFRDRLYGYTDRFNVAGFGFPELLSDVAPPDPGRGFSHAIFEQGQLVKNTGDYNYPRSLDVFRQQARNSKQFIHTVEHRGSSTAVVSYRDRTWVEKFAMVTYILLLAEVALAFYAAGERRFSFKPSLKQRIQFTVIGIVCVAVGIFAGLAHYYILNEFAEKNRLVLAEKSNSVITELNQKIREEKDLTEQTAYLNQFLGKLSTVFFTDITLYDTRGTLIASSQPALFERYILSGKIDPVAYHELRYKASNLYIQEENIGQLSYLSAYRPFVSPENQTIAFVNLPYFAKQAELDDQLSVFLVSVVNALVVLLALAIAAAIFLSERITAPLKMLREKLEGIDLSSGETIGYTAQDEIGALVGAYNTKVRELSEKVEQLSATQRELAWREMAKQVAHEIKNPLTPMKLSAQHLLRTIGENEENWRERVRAFIQGLIEQIDTLSKIANEFSNYAQLPERRDEETDLAALVESSAAIYREQDEIEVETQLLSSPVYITADRDLILSVLNNLLKNAEFAISAALAEKLIHRGHLEVRLWTEHKKAVVTVRDNGTGIDDHIRENIFAPNFTTKSGGMGLGLAMVRQIINQYGGTITFETTKGQGTTFRLELPLTRREGN